VRPAGKTACLVFLFILISPLYGQSFPDEELPPEPQPNPEGEGSPPDDRLFFFEELFIFEDIFSLEFLMDEGDLPGEETLFVEEPFPGEELFLGEEPFPGEETFYDEETLLAWEALPDEDTSLFEAPPLIFEVPVFEIRSLDAIFPNLSRLQRITAMSNEGFRHSFVNDESAMLVPNPDLGIDLLGSIMKKNPSHIIEALAVVPYNERELDLLDVYNAVGEIEKIKDHSVFINGNDYYIFTESTRIESARNRRDISDPLPAVTLPFSETIYLRLKEISFGNLFLRGDISLSMYGLTYSMTNFTDVRYFLFPIMRAERFITIIYLEPVREGVLIYSMSGFYLPGFIADRVNLTPNINRRIETFIKWITDGLRKQESAATEQRNAGTGR
jgi:hypothetical protein